MASVICETADEGQVDIVDGTDDWTKGVSAPDRITVPSNEYVDVPVRVAAPASAKADIHLVGLALSPVRDGSGGVDVRTEAVTYVSVDIPGKANRSVSLKALGLPRFVMGNKVKGQLAVRNTGDAGLRFRAQVFMNSARSKQNLGVVVAGDRTAALLPTGRLRTVSYSWQEHGLFAAVRPKAEVAVLNADAGAAGVSQQLPVIIFVHPAVLIAIGSTIGILLLALANRWFRRRRARVALPQA